MELAWCGIHDAFDAFDYATVDETGTLKEGKTKELQGKRVAKVREAALRNLTTQFASLNALTTELDLLQTRVDAVSRAVLSSGGST